MNSRIKKILAVLLSAVMVMSVAFVSTAAGPRYERPELNKTDTVKTTGTWSKDANGFWSLTAENKKVAGSWYYANMVNSSTEYRWYHFDEKGIMSTGWVIDKKDPSIWYYTGETKDRTEGSLVTGWVTDPQDGQKYYMDPATGQMSHGWVKIDNSWYYFAERKDANRSWAPDANGYWSPANKTGHSYGSLYRSEMTPDGYYVDGTGAWRQSSGSSSGGSSRRNPDPTPTPTPTPTPDPVMTAKASTTTPQHAGQSFDQTGLKITIVKNGKKYVTVSAEDELLQINKITVNGEDGGTLEIGSNDIKISFVYCNGDVLIGQSMTTEVFTVDGLTYTVTFDANGGSGEPSEIKEVLHGSRITEPTEKPTREGYVFGGWYKDAACTDGKEWDFDKDTVTENTTLYAKWTECIPAFTINSSGDTVEFSPGLLYWDGGKFNFETNQYDFRSSWDADHVNHFYWSSNASVAYAEEYNDPSPQTTDTFFADGLPIGGKTWRTLSNAEWEYLINTRTNAENKIGFATVAGKKGIIILPDIFTDPMKNNGSEAFVPKASTGYTQNVYTEENWAAMEKAGAVFLPVAGYREGTDVYTPGLGYYWSSTPIEDDYVYNLAIASGGVGLSDSGRDEACFVRLVK